MPVRRWKPLALFAVALAVSGVLAEFVYRNVVRARREAAVQAFDHGLFEVAPDKPYLYWPKKNHRETKHVPQVTGPPLAWEVSTDRYRCRGEDRDLSKLELDVAPGHVRVREAQLDLRGRRPAHRQGLAWSEHGALASGRARLHGHLGGDGHDVILSLHVGRSRAGAAGQVG